MLLLATGGRLIARFFSSLRGTWWLWSPAAGGLAALCLVYVERRYLAGLAGTLSFCALAAIWNARTTRLLSGVCWCAFFAGSLIASADPVATAMMAGRELAGRVENPGVVPRLSRQLQEYGLSPGAQVAIIGDPLGVPWLAVCGAKLVAAVPASFQHDETELERTPKLSLEHPDEFWSSPRTTQESVLETFYGLGAEIAIARTVPDSADTSGWTRVSGIAEFPDGHHQAGIYVRRLGPSQAPQASRP